MERMAATETTPLVVASTLDRRTPGRLTGVLLPVVMVDSIDRAIWPTPLSRLDAPPSILPVALPACCLIRLT